MQQNPTNNPQALQTIYHAGGHFVLCLEDKRPVWRSWQKLRPGLDVVLAHNGPLGLQPWSISTTALDVDAGDPGELVQAWPPMAVLNSRRAGGRHLYYSDTAGRGNAHFEAYGCAGEIRSAKGYLILWHDGAARLADALHDPIARARRWPRDLFELAGVGAVTLPAAVKKPTYRYKPSDQSRQTWAAAAAALELETIKQGLRNVKLFDSVRFWAYSVPRGQDLEAWTRRVRVHALEQNRRFPEPLDESEVKQTAYSISTWCWSGGGARWSVVAWIGVEMEFALSQAIASGDAFEHRPSECGHCVQDFLADLDLRDLPGEAAGFKLGSDDALPTADLCFYPAALVVPCG